MLTLNPQLVNPANSRPKPFQMATVRATDTGGLNSGTAVRNLPASAGDTRDTSSIPGSGRSPGGGHGKPTAVFLPGESHGQRSLAGYNP